jgi:hypothetical protein
MDVPGSPLLEMATDVLGELSGPSYTVRVQKATGHRLTRVSEPKFTTYHPSRATLIVVPNNILFQWKQEFEKVGIERE